MPVEIHTEKYDSEIPTRDASSHFKTLLKFGPDVFIFPVFETINSLL